MAVIIYLIFSGFVAGYLFSPYVLLAITLLCVVGCVYHAFARKLGGLFGDNLITIAVISNIVMWVSYLIFHH